MQYGDCCPGCEPPPCFCDAVCGQVECRPDRSRWECHRQALERAFDYNFFFFFFSPPCPFCLLAVWRLLPRMCASSMLLRRRLRTGRSVDRSIGRSVGRPAGWLDGSMDECGIMIYRLVIAVVFVRSFVRPQYGDCCPGCETPPCYCDAVCNQVCVLCASLSLCRCLPGSQTDRPTDRLLVPCAGCSMATAALAAAVETAFAMPSADRSGR